MLRSLIAHVFFLFAIAATSLAGLQSARAEIPFEAWLSVAADSLDHQIAQQIELPWQTLGSIGRRTAKSFDRVMDQCRMGVGGTRGLQLVRVIDLLVELRDSGVAGVVAPTKNWNFPAENYELQQCRMVKGDLRSQPCRELKAEVSPKSAAIVENFSAVLRHGSVGQQLFQTAWLAGLAAHAKEAIVRLEEAVFSPAEPLVQAANRAWEKLTAMPDQNRAEVSDKCEKTAEISTLSDVSTTFEAGVFASYWTDVSNSAQAKLNWLTSKVRHIAEAYLRSIEPQFLILELDPMA